MRCTWGVQEVFWELRGADFDPPPNALSTPKNKIPAPSGVQGVVQVMFTWNFGLKLSLEQNPLKTCSLNKVMPYRDIEKRNEYNKRYWEERKDTINEPRREKFKCGCGGSYTKCHQSTHAKSRMHVQWLINEPIERRRLLEERTNPDIANIILEFLG